MPASRDEVLLAMLPPQAEHIQNALRPTGLRTVRVSDLNGLRASLAAGLELRLVLTQISLSDGNWRDVVRIVRRVDRAIRVILYAPAPTTELWMDALDSGVYDLVSAGDDDALRSAVLRAIPEDGRC